MPQSPVFKKVTTLPATLQLPFGIAVNETGKPELAVAVSVSVSPTLCCGMGLNVMT
jgi:hypothetical protein